jgi:hypothetical protein
MMFKLYPTLDQGSHVVSRLNYASALGMTDVVVRIYRCCYMCKEKGLVVTKGPGNFRYKRNSERTV